MILSAPVSGSITRTNGPLSHPMSVPTITPLDGTTTSTVSVLFAGSGSYSRPDTVAVLVTVPPVARVTFAVMASVGIVPSGTVPTVHTPVPGS